MFAPKRADARQQPYLQKRRQCGDLQRAGAAVVLDLLQGGLELFETGSHGGQQFQTFVGDFDAPAGSPKQRYLDIPFQRLDLLADGGGRHIECIGGGRKTQMSGHGLEYAQRSQRQSVVGGRHFKFSLTHCQTLRLLRSGPWSNVTVAGSKSNSEYIMNQINLERLAQGLLTVTIVF